MQSKKSSFVEAVVNTLIGLVTTILISPLIYQVCGVKMSMTQMGLATVLFTIASIIRNYIIRRWFANKESGNWLFKLLSKIKPTRMTVDFETQGHGNEPKLISVFGMNASSMAEVMRDGMESDIIDAMIKDKGLVTDLVKDGITATQLVQMYNENLIFRSYAIAKYRNRQVLQSCMDITTHEVVIRYVEDLEFRKELDDKLWNYNVNNLTHSNDIINKIEWYYDMDVKFRKMINEMLSNKLTF